jgi:hypothetical protein
MVFMHVSLGMPLVIAFVLTVIVVTVLGVVLDRLAIHPIRQPSVMTLIIATVAASMIIKGAAMLVWGKNPYDLPAFSGRVPIDIGGVVLQSQYLWVIGFLVLIAIGLALFFNRTILGKAMRACADNAMPPDWSASMCDRWSCSLCAFSGHRRRGRHHLDTHCVDGLRSRGHAGHQRVRCGHSRRAGQFSRRDCGRGDPGPDRIIRRRIPDVRL